MRRLKTVILLLLSALVLPPAFAESTGEELIELARKSDPRAFEFSQSLADITPTEDGRSFTVWWQPKYFDAGKDTVFVSLHGSAGWATKGFSIWQPRIEERGYAFLGIQWWFGSGGAAEDYASPRDIYGWITAELRKRGIPAKHVIFSGFSRGSANSYAVTYLDTLEDEPYFAVTIANAGAMEEGYPPNREFLEFTRDTQPFFGTHWILYCSENDEQRPGSCGQMQWTQSTLEDLGGHVEKFFRDPEGPHGGFMHPLYLDEALDVSDRLVSESR